MAHNLDVINGKASFAYAGRPGWHGLGQAIPPGMEDSETVSELAGLNRTVALVPLYTMVDGQPVALQDKFATVYKDTGFVLGVVGSRYTVVQNATAFGAIDRWLADGRVRYETAGALALDLQRYLGDEPVTAVKPRPIYHLRKFARRHRVALATAACGRCR